MKIEKSKRELAWEKYLAIEFQDIKETLGKTDSEVEAMLNEEKKKGYSFILAVREKMKDKFFNGYSDEEIEKFLEINA